MLFGVSGAMRARGAGSKRPDKDPAVKGGEAKELPRQRSARKAEPAVKDEDMDDIEAILRKHGIQ